MRMHIHTPVHDTTFEPRITVFSTTSLLSSSLPLTIYTSEKRKERESKRERGEGKRKEERERTIRARKRWSIDTNWECDDAARFRRSEEDRHRSIAAQENNTTASIIGSFRRFALCGPRAIVIRAGVSSSAVGGCRSRLRISNGNNSEHVHIHVRTGSRSVRNNTNNRHR